MCVRVYKGIVVWKSLKLHHPSQIRCEFEGNDLSDGKKCAKKKCHQGDITKVNYTIKIIPNYFLKDKTLINVHILYHISIYI